MQTSPSKFSRVIGFDRKTHQQALHLQNAGTPARLLSANEKDGKLFVNQYTTVAKANSNDITFESQQPSTSSDNSDLPSVTATEIKLNQLHSLTRNQRVNVKATITSCNHIMQQSCRKKMPYSVGSTTFTCTSCGTCQKVKLAKKGATARLCAEMEGHQTWLTVFTDEMEALLKKLDLTINTPSDQIKEALLSLENITLVIDPVSNFILEVIEE